ncbi:MAG: tetratricopeptide repeat protein, partial [Pirellulaceae bacterium]
MARNRLRSDAADVNLRAADRDSSSLSPELLTHETSRFRGWRGWLLRILLVLAAPIIFLSVIEVGLRWTGYGFPTHFFLGPDAQGICWSNDQFGWRFFPRSLAREPEPSRLPAKSPATVRIFVLGGSAAMGMPNPAFNFGRILEVMLGAQYPDTRFEVVNTAMTAINSYVVREIASDCAPHGADIFVVYMGNNEVVGPFGPGTVFQQWSRSLPMVRFTVSLKSMRVGQLLGDAIELGRGATVSDTWHGMEMFLGNEVAADDPRLTMVYDNFRSNLTDICALARRAGIAVLFSTVAVNLKDCPPLASRHRSDLSSEDLARWESLFQAGVAAHASGDLTLAIEHWNAAAEIDDHYAELQFRLGQCLATAGRMLEARQRFVRASDLDTLRFRADSRINAIVREVAEGQKLANVWLVDAERAFAQGATGAGSIPGEDLFYEHVHLNFDGNYLLALTVLDRVAEALPESVRSGRVGHVPSKKQCAEWLALTPWDEFHMADVMAQLTSRPPFTNQVDHDIRQSAATERVENLRKRALSPQTLNETVRIYEAALNRRPEYWYLRDRLEHLGNLCNRPDVAIDQLRTVLRVLP